MVEQTAAPAVLFERQGAIGWVILNRPEAMNAINSEVKELIPRIIKEADADPEVRVLVVRGNGERAFCAGADIKEFRAPDSIVQVRQNRTHEAPIRFFGTAVKPVIAAIHGFCLGGGLEMSLSCDIRIASEDAQLGLPEVTLGIIPGAGGTQRLSRVVGLGNALRIILSGERISAQEAYRLGLVSAVVPRDQLLAEAERLANVIASRPPIAVAFAKESIHRGFDMAIEDGLKLESDFSALLQTTEDRVEAATAFREKRKPVFKGR